MDQVHWPETLFGKEFLADPRLEAAPTLNFDLLLFFSSAPSSRKDPWVLVPALPPPGENLYSYSARLAGDFLGGPALPDKIQTYEKGLAIKFRPPLTLPSPTKGREYLLAPGAGSASKRWPLNHFLALAAVLPSPPAFLLGPAEPESWDARIQGRGFNVLRPDISGLRAVIRGFSHFIGNDSGPGHLAAQEGLDCLILYGPTDPAFWAPPGRVRVLRAAQGLLERLELREVQSVLGFLP